MRRALQTRRCGGRYDGWTLAQILAHDHGEVHGETYIRMLARRHGGHEGDMAAVLCEHLACS